MRPVIARCWFALTALTVLAGLLIQCFATAGVHAGHFTTTPARLLNLLFFFTIESNIIVGVTSLLLAIRLRRTATVFAALRMAGLVGISITGIVFYAVLKDLYDLTGAAKLSDFLLHTMVPLMTVLGWLVFGPRGIATPRAASLSVLYPLAYFAVTLIRGPIVHFYPYPFVDVAGLGYGRVLGNAVIVAALFVGVAFVASALDRWLTRLHPPPAGAAAAR